MNKKRKSSLESLFYNNRFLMVFCILVSIVIWATVKVNYSAETLRTINDVKISLTNSNSETSELIPFIDEDELYADVEVTGKAYNINTYALSKDDIVVEASGSYVDSAGYRVLTLTARTVDGASGVKITEITPSSLTVYYDRKATETFNVEARLNNKLDSLVEGDFTVGQPVPSMNTIDVTGPATILNKLSKVYFEASVSKDDLPLTASKVVPVEISFDLERQNDAKYLICEGISDESNPATVTIPVYVTKEVPTQVKFINEPAYFAENPPSVTITPSKVELSYNPSDEEIDVINIGTVDFRELSNKVNRFNFAVDEKLLVNLVQKDIDSFSVSVDMSSMSRKTFDLTPNKIVFLNQVDGYSYSVDIDRSSLDSITVIGPKESLNKITTDDIQVEINVSSLSVNMRRTQTVEVSNISIINESINDCWIYGKYEAVIDVSPLG